MRLLLDTANLSDIRYFNEYFPIEGVTTNPTILATEGGNVLELLTGIRSIIGWDKELHVQVTEKTFDGIVEEAIALVNFLGENTFVKIPATDTGLKATKYLSKRGYKITVTAILSEAQGMLATNAGAAYVAPYVSRLDNLCADGVGTVKQISDIIRISGSKTQVLAASFKTAKEVLDVAAAGCHCATVGSSVMKNLLSHTTTDASIARFDNDWKNAFGDITLLSLLKDSKN
jgi:fructose-6-phosphate aldolase 2